MIEYKARATALRLSHSQHFSVLQCLSVTVLKCYSEECYSVTAQSCCHITLLLSALTHAQHSSVTAFSSHLYSNDFHFLVC